MQLLLRCARHDTHVERGNAFLWHKLGKREIKCSIARSATASLFKVMRHRRQTTIASLELPRSIATSGFQKDVCSSAASSAWKATILISVQYE